MSIGRIIFLIVVAFALTALVYTGVWHLFTQFFWQHPMLSWLPILAFFAAGFAAGALRSLTQTGPGAGSPDKAPTEVAGASPAQVLATGSAPTPSPGRFAFGWGFLAGLAVVLAGLFFTLISKPAVGLDRIDYEVVAKLPERTQPRLLPRSGIRDDPSFRDAKEIHLVRDPISGELLWTGEWQGSWLNGPSVGIAQKPLDDVISQSEIVKTGFDPSVAALSPGTLKGQAKIDHPFSGIQYPVLVPNGPDEAFAIAPYVGFRDFPIRTPYLKGVLVYHQDGAVEDLTPEEAASRPELVRTGRIVPESVARAEAEALSRSDEFEGEIKDGEGNTQPFLTAIDENTTAWITIINEKEHQGGVRAVVLKDSSTGETEVWVPPKGKAMISTEDVYNEARSLPLRWEEQRCCDSEGHSYTVDLREVVEPRLAFKEGRPYYLVTVVPTSDLALPREVEFTLLMDAESGEVLDRFEHVNEGPLADARLQRFFR